MNNTDRIKELEKKLAMLTESGSQKTSEAKQTFLEFTDAEKTALEAILNELPSDAVVLSGSFIVLGKKTYSKKLNEKIAEACNIEAKLKEANISGKLSAVVMPVAFSRYFDE